MRHCMERKEVCQVCVILIIMQRAPNAPCNQGTLQKWARNKFVTAVTRQELSVSSDCGHMHVHEDLLCSLVGLHQWQFWQLGWHGW